MQVLVPACQGWFCGGELIALDCTHARSVTPTPGTHAHSHNTTAAATAKQRRGEPSPSRPHPPTHPDTCPCGCWRRGRQWQRWLHQGSAYPRTCSAPQISEQASYQLIDCTAGPAACAARGACRRRCWASSRSRPVPPSQRQRQLENRPNPNPTGPLTWPSCSPSQSRGTTARARRSAPSGWSSWRPSPGRGTGQRRTGGCAATGGAGGRQGRECARQHAGGRRLQRCSSSRAGAPVFAGRRGVRSRLALLARGTCRRSA